MRLDMTEKRKANSRECVEIRNGEKIFNHVQKIGDPLGTFQGVVTGIVSAKENEEGT